MDIRLSNVCKAFADKVILKNFCWEINYNSVWQLDGTSGIGKTTLLRLLMGLEIPDEGTIDGISGMRISACFQEHRLCEWLTARQNIRLVTGMEIEDNIIQKGLTYLLEPDVLDQPVRVLSGGMQRRVALVRAMLPESDMILLDEPFAGLDAAHIQRALDFITENRRGRTLILVSHEAHELREPFQVRMLER